ncbi:MAG: hypothetical protein JRJ69_16545, partial [Deltaproteobacteria bacterium]|nr:hypothetical protein [Deltaproteobacteria bacterium]
DGAWQSSQTGVLTHHYNDYGTGLVATGAQKYGNFWVYICHDGHVHVVYGLGNYKYAEAIAAANPVNLPTIVSDFAMLLARITVKTEETSTFTNISTPWDSEIISGTVTTHDSLSNLAFADSGHTGFQAQGDVLDDLNTLGANAADSEFLVGTGAGTLAWESGATARTSMGVGVTDDVEFQSLLIDQDTDAIGLKIESAATTDTNYGLSVITSAGAMVAEFLNGDGNAGMCYLGLLSNNAFSGTYFFGRNLTAASTDCPVVYMVQDHADDDQPVLEIQQDGSGDALLTNGNIQCNGDMTVAGGAVIGLNSAIFQPTADSTTFFQILDADGGTSVFNVDTTNERVGIGTTLPDAKAEVETGTNDNIQYGIESHYKDRKFAGPGYGFHGRCSVSTPGDGLAHARGAFRIFSVHDITDGRTNSGDQIGMSFINSINTHSTGVFTGTVYGLKMETSKDGTGTFPTNFYQVYLAEPDLATNHYGIYQLGGSVINHLEGFTGFGSEVAPETLIELTHATPYITLHNSTHEDSDGGRESQLIFKGEQGVDPFEEGTLAMIEASHDGTGEDYKGKVVISTNANGGADTLVDALTIDSAQAATFTGDITANNLSGSNTGDQTSIVGITGTKAQFDAACTDGDFMYVGGAPTAHLHDGDTLECDGINSSAGAFAFDTGGLVTFNNSILLDTGADLQVSGHVIFNTNLSYIGFTNPRITFDDTNDKLVVTGGLELTNEITEFS